MEDLFVPYNTALTLKQKGFDLDCFTTYDQNGLLDNHWDTELDYHNDFFENPKARNPKRNSETKNVCAPLWQQVIEWFRDSHNIHIHPNFHKNKFSEGMDYEYQMHYQVNNEWQCMKIMSKDSRDNAIYQALKLI